MKVSPEIQETYTRSASTAGVDAAKLVDLGQLSFDQLDFGLGVRDAAYLLGLSHQRVQQLVRGSS